MGKAIVTDIERTMGAEPITRPSTQGGTKACNKKHHDHPIDTLNYIIDYIKLPRQETPNSVGGGVKW